MVELSFVDVEISLALLVSDAQIRFNVYHQLVALHEVKHGVLKARNQLSIVLKNVEIDEFVGYNLELVDTLDVVDEALYIKREVFSPLQEIFGRLRTLI